MAYSEPSQLTANRSSDAGLAGVVLAAYHPHERAARPERSTDPLHNFDTLWNTFKNRYAHFDTRGVNWDDAYRTYRSQLTRSSSQVQLFEVTRKMLESLGDAHVSLDAPSSIERQASPRPGSPDFRSVQRDIVSRYVRQPQSHFGGKLVWGDIDNRTAYIQINSFEGFDKGGVRNAMAKIMPRLANKSSVILDLRFNEGGDDTLADEIMRHFIDRPIDAYSFKTKLRSSPTGDVYTPWQYAKLQPAQNTFTKDVYMLTSRMTGSAAEMMALASISMPHVQRIGTTTNGILSDVLEGRMPNGWKYSLSHQVYRGPDGRHYEKVGIPPHHRVDYPMDEPGLHRRVRQDLHTGDRAIDYALRLRRHA